MTRDRTCMQQTNLRSEDIPPCSNNVFHWLPGGSKSFVWFASHSANRVRPISRISHPRDCKNHRQPKLRLWWLLHYEWWSVVVTFKLHYMRFGQFLIRRVPFRIYTWSKSPTQWKPHAVKTWCFFVITSFEAMTKPASWIGLWPRFGLPCFLCLIVSFSLKQRWNFRHFTPLERADHRTAHMQPANIKFKESPPL